MFVAVNGARIFFDTVGPKLAVADERMAERPTLIVMHGGPGFDHSSMRPYFDRFADSHQVVYIDHRANGRSTGALSECTLARWGDDVKEICDALGIEKPAVYGNSFGGMVAMSYAARHPGHPAKLILSSTAARMHWDETFRIFAGRGGAEARTIAENFWTAGDDASIADYMRVCMPLYNPPGDNAGELARARKRSLMRYETMRYFAMGEMKTMDLRGGLPDIKCPTLILAGGYDPITPVACAREILDAMPKGIAELDVFQAAGHGVHRDDPDGAERSLRRFLAA